MRILYQKEFSSSIAQPVPFTQLTPTPPPFFSLPHENNHVKSRKTPFYPPKPGRACRASGPRTAVKLSYPRKLFIRNYAASYAVARCCSWRPSRTLTTLETPGSCMVTP